MKVLVTGAKGQLGRDVVERFSKPHTVYGFGRNELDVTNAEQTRAVVGRVKPDVIIHTAAYTAVDNAEENREQAYLVNAQGSRNIALAANECGAKLCAISTDYVFDGEARHPYTEDATANPKNVYGASKLAGENVVKQCTNRYFIVRTSWVLGVHGNNFVKTMLKLGKSGEPIKVVNDQFGSPTYTRDLAEFLLELTETDKFGVYHTSNTGVCSWYEFAREIFEQTSLPAKPFPCSTADYPRPAPRPKYSVLAHKAMESNGFRHLPPWQDALRRFLGELHKYESARYTGHETYSNED